MRPWLVSLTCCLHLFTQKCTYPVESSVSALQLLTLDSSLNLIWAAQQHFVCFQQVLAWTVILLIVAVDVEVLFECLVRALSLAIALWVVTGCEVEAHIEGFSERPEEVGDELSTVIWGNMGGNTVLGEYMK